LEVLRAWRRRKRRSIVRRGRRVQTRERCQGGGVERGIQKVSIGLLKEGKVGLEKA